LTALLRPKVSVLITTKNGEKTIESCLLSVIANSDLHEVIVLDDSLDRTREIVSKYPVTLIYTPNKNTAEKNNVGLEHTSGDVIALTDQDCIVPADWIERGSRYFEDGKVGAVGGPNLTRIGAPLYERCAGYLLSSRFGSGSSFSRYAVTVGEGEYREIDESELISCNLFCRREAIVQAGMFDPKLDSCEENALLHEMKRLGFKLLHVQTLYVWHHRRPLFRPFIKQIIWYAHGRACMIRKDWRSLKPIYTLPSLFALGLLTGPLLSLFNQFISFLYISAVVLYLLSSIGASIEIAFKQRTEMKVIPILTVGFLSIHFAYGIGFLYGLLGRRYRYTPN
jgi:glycosyltransferase involved in cell wall biosynthesis